MEKVAEQWIECGPNFAMGDIIRWVEPVWAPRVSPRAKGIKIGYRLVEAQVMRCDREWAVLEVRPAGCKLRLVDGCTVEPLGVEIRRRRGPIGHGYAERLLVGCEATRSVVASRYLNEHEDVSVAVPKAEAPSPRNWPPVLPRGGGSSRRGFGRKGKGPKLRRR